ncbi:hypothetical protein ACIQ9J_01865 [Streptomyces sp. NPDC094153]|uniref:hypothetical protein n=1 Tax=Streptomyces sp. NPDC094153 TaxID=3366058 RepID=UPI0037FEC128
MLGGLALVLHGLLHDHSTLSLAGVALSMIALTGIILAVVHRWITDTNTERTILAASQREAQRQQTVYIAGQAALENERTRLHRDLAAEHAALNERLKAERASLTAEFEERRAALISETMEATVLMIRDGKFAPEPQTDGNLIHFPEQHPGRAPVRTREHGVVGP